jgi:hypothetical protein
MLPDCDDLFTSFFGKWHDEAGLATRSFKATRPDVERWAAPSTLASDASRLTLEGQSKVIAHIQTMFRAAEADWPTYLAVAGAPSVGWIGQFDQYWTAERVSDLLGRSDPSSYDNDLLVTVGEFGAVLGETMRQEAPQLEWLADWPYWESGLLDVPSGNRINVFHWAIKRFSDYGIHDGYVEKRAMCLQLVQRNWDA